MNRSRKIIALLLAAVLLLAALPAAGLAVDYNIQPMTLNKWITFNYQNTLYKLKVSGEVVVNFSWKNADTSNSPYFAVYRDAAGTGYLQGFNFDSASGTGGVVLYSGTYYIRTYDYNEKAKVKFTTKKAATINKANYCASKAALLKAGKKVEIAQTLKSNYTRWYKIKLTKTQAISISSMGLELYYLTLYDSNMNEIHCSGSNGQYVTDGYQPRGTYYLAIDQRSTSNLRTYGKYSSFSWK